MNAQSAPVAIAPDSSSAVSDGLPSTSWSWPLRIAIAALWISYAIFALYIVTRFMLPLLASQPERWNRSLPDLYVAGSGAANLGMGAHLALGALLMGLGPVQFMNGVRRRWPKVHRWTGRLYVGAAFITAIGGLVFIALRGTIGGPPMSVGFFMSGSVVAICAVETLRHALKREFVTHREWGIRLFMILLSGWLYRMYYGVWGLATGCAGCGRTMNGPFDVVMDFWFWVPTMLATEFFLRSARQGHSPRMRILWSAGLVIGTLFLALGTYAYTRRLWGSVIVSAFFG